MPYLHPNKRGVHSTCATQQFSSTAEGARQGPPMPPRPPLSIYPTCSLLLLLVGAALAALECRCLCCCLTHQLRINNLHKTCWRRGLGFMVYGLVSSRREV